MNIKHLGDKIDWWKAAVLMALRHTKTTERLRLVPMFRGAWTDPCKDKYSTTLGVVRGDILSEEVFSRTGSGATNYFMRIGNALRAQPKRPVDLFVDPDTGFGDPTTGTKDRSGDKKRHHRISHDEVVALTRDAGDGSLVIVYDQSCRNEDEIADHARGTCRDLVALGLSAASLTCSTQRGLQLVFVSFSSSRIAGLDAASTLLKQANLARLVAAT